MWCVYFDPRPPGRAAVTEESHEYGLSHMRGEAIPHTRKFPEMRDCDQAKPSVHRLMPLSSTLKMKTAPLLTIVRRSKSFSLRVTLGIIPRRAACQWMEESPV